jgi:hypothetical protein
MNSTYHEFFRHSDMVHNNPGEAPFVTKFNDTAFLKSWGYTGQCPKFFLPAAITYDSFDAFLLPAGPAEREWSEKMAAAIDGHLKDAKANNMPLYPLFGEDDRALEIGDAIKSR